MGNSKKQGKSKASKEQIEATDRLLDKASQGHQTGDRAADKLSFLRRRTGNEKPDGTGKKDPKG